MSLPDHVRFILVGSESPGNIGAAARAIKTMGMRRLVLVAPACDPLCDEARALAHNALDVLEAAARFESLAAALADTQYSIATTQRDRRLGYVSRTAAEIARDMQPLLPTHEIALVFGRESSGLTNEELECCTTTSTIPAATRLPALNLAQAVMLYAYEFYQASLAPPAEAYPYQLAPHAELESFYQHLGETLARLGARPAVSMERWVAKFRRVYSRIPLESRDMQLLFKMLQVADEYVSRNPPPEDSR